MVLDIGEDKWILISEQDTDEAFSQVNQLDYIYIVIALITFAAILLTAIYASRGLTEPISKLVQSIDNISQGHLGIRVEGVHSRDEIGYLAGTFNEMAEKLQSAHKKLEEKNRQLERSSNRDSLTYLFNRRYVKEFIENEINLVERYQLKFSCLMLDLDYFKKINDSFGHLFGDFVLCELARLLKDSVRRVDIVGRYGGEEFIIVLPQTDMQGAIKVADKILSKVSQHTFSDPNYTAQLTVSIGVAEYVPEMKSFENFVGSADQALYKAKEGGRNKRCS